MKHIKEKNIYLFIISYVMILLLFTSFATSQKLLIRHYTESTEKLTEPIRIAVITDLHNTLYGEHQSELINATKEQNPDFICFVGDLINSINHINGAIDLISALTIEYKCYYVSGNHEFWSKNCNNFKEKLRFYGVTVLEGTTASIHIRDNDLKICGIDDPEISEELGHRDQDWNEQLDKCNKNTGKIYSILLSHRPERVQDYDKCSFDLILSGHAHGGQFRIPLFLNGLYAPNQGFFPKYAGGRYTLSNSIMIVSRGLVRNSAPRVFNRPELVIIDIDPTK